MLIFFPFNLDSGLGHQPQAGLGGWQGSLDLPPPSRDMNLSGHSHLHSSFDSKTHGKDNDDVEIMSSDSSSSSSSDE